MFSIKGKLSGHYYKKRNSPGSFIVNFKQLVLKNIYGTPITPITDSEVYVDFSQKPFWVNKCRVIIRRSEIRRARLMLASDGRKLMWGVIGFYPVVSVQLRMAPSNKIKGEAALFLLQKKIVRKPKTRKWLKRKKTLCDFLDCQ